MNSDDIGFLEWAFKGSVAGLFTIGGWLWIMLIGKIREQEKSIYETKENLGEHKLHVSENYAKKIDLSPIYNKLDDVQNDIKILLGRKQEKDR